MFEVLSLPGRRQVNEYLHMDGVRRLWGWKVGDLGFSEFLLKAQWLAKKLGRDLVKIGRWEPSTQSCKLLRTPARDAA
jgi:putative transposase